MPVGNRASEDAQPLARPVHDQPLARPVDAEQEENTQEAGEQEEEAHQEAAQQQPEAEEQEKGRVEQVLDKAQANGWVYDSMAQKAREQGLVSKADELLNKAMSRLTGR